MVFRIFLVLYTFPFLLSLSADASHAPRTLPEKISYINHPIACGNLVDNPDQIFFFTLYVKGVVSSGRYLHEHPIPEAHIYLLDRLTRCHFTLGNTEKASLLLGELSPLILSQKSSQAIGLYFLAHRGKGEKNDQSLDLWGRLLFVEKRYEEAEKVYHDLLENSPHSPLRANAYFWIARCAEERQDRAKQRHFQQCLFKEFPSSPLAPEAYFFTYNFLDYLQGNRQAMKHLQAFKTLFPETHLLINAHYLIGLDYSHDRKTPEGRWIQKKDLTAAINAYHEAEIQFDTLLTKGEIPLHALERSRLIRNHAVMERGLTYLTIAEASEGAKRQIYLEYAERVLRSLIASENLPSKLREEASFWLAKTLVYEGNDSAADEIFTHILSNCIQQNPIQALTWYEKALLAMRAGHCQDALSLIAKAEHCGGEGNLRTDERLELHIQRSHCYRALGRLKDAMLVLSQVIDDPAVSGLRLKAMYLRAQIYELQGRQELALRQLKSMAPKGGEWALQAKIKLEKDYGYD